MRWALPLLLAGLGLGTTTISAAMAQESRWMPTTLAPIVEEALPAVVNISSEKIIRTQREERSPFFSDPFFRYFFGDPLRRRVPRERREQSLGSGVIISPDGYVVTNNHVLQTGDSQVKVYWEDESYDATIVGRDAKTDVALLKIDARTDLPHLVFGDSDALLVGDFVLAMGNPFGLDRTVTMGIVSAVGRADVGIVDYEDFIQTDAAINPGNSGGALLNLSGELVGINTAIMSRSGGYQGIGFAIPSRMARRVIDSIREYGEVRRGWLGFGVQNLTADLASAMDLNRDVGILVSDVHPDGPADEAGIRSGDIVLAIDGRDVHNLSDFAGRTERLLPGMEAQFTVLSGDEIRTATIRVTRQPDDFEAFDLVDFDSSALPGLGLEALDAAAAARLGYSRRTRGLVVTDVEPGSAGAEAGLRPGDLVVEVERVRVWTMTALEEVVGRAQGDKLLLLVYRGRRGYYVALPRS